MQLESSKIEEYIGIQLSNIINNLCAWIRDQAHRKKVVFLSREGWTIGENYLKLFPAENVGFVRSSRILLNNVNIEKEADLLAEIKKPSKDTYLDDFLKYRFGMVENRTLSIPDRYYEKKLKRREIEQLITEPSVFKIFSDYFFTHASEKRKFLTKYYSDHFISDDVILVDIGYNGSFRKSIQTMFPAINFTGLYLGTMDQASANDYGFLFDKVSNNNDNYNIENNVLLLELLLSRSEGTVIGINRDGVPILDQQDIPNKISRIQKNILANNTIGSNYKESLDFILSPSLELINYFKNDHIEDLYRGNRQHFMISQRKIIVCSNQKRKFIKESAWRNGAKAIADNKILNL